MVVVVGVRPTPTMGTVGYVEVIGEKVVVAVGWCHFGALQRVMCPRPDLHHTPSLLGLLG